MIADLSKSKGNLLALVDSIIEEKVFHDCLEAFETESIVKENRLYWNLGFSQGYAVIDLKEKEIYRTFYTDETLNHNSVCDSAVAELVFESISDFMYEIQYMVAAATFSQYIQLLAKPSKNDLLM